MSESKDRLKVSKKLKKLIDEDMRMLYHIYMNFDKVLGEIVSTGFSVVRQDEDKLN